MKTAPLITLIKSDLHKQGGLEKYTWQIARDFCSQQIPLRILTTPLTTPPFTDPYLEIVELDIYRTFSALHLLHFDHACAQYLKNHPTPIIFSLDRNRFQTHIRAGNGVHAAYLQSRGCEEGVLKRCSFYLNPLHRAILSLEKRAFEHPELKTLFTNSEMVKKQVLEFYHTDPSKIRVVHNGVEWHEFAPAFEGWEEDKQKHLKTYGLDKDALHFLFVGHNYIRKGLHKLLYALESMRDEPFQLLVVGKERNLPYFQKLTERLGLKNRVIFFGAQKQILPFYQMADCTVIPSLYDPFANVTVESLAMGIYTISSKTNGGHEVLTPENGAVIPSLEDSDTFSALLKNQCVHKKNMASAQQIRLSSKHLDFSSQLRIMTQSILSGNPNT